MTAKITGENKKTVKIGYCKMIPVILETLLHESLKYSQCIHEAKQYPYPLIKITWSKEGCEVTSVERSTLSLSLSPMMPSWPF